MFRIVVRNASIAAFAACFLVVSAVGAWAMDDATGPVGIEVGSQPVVEARIIIPTVDSGGAAWVVIHTQTRDGKMGPAIGYAAVTNGQTKYLPVAIDMAKVAPMLWAVLHVDRGTVGIFEYPGPDEPAKRSGEVIYTVFEVSY